MVPQLIDIDTDNLEEELSLYSWGKTKEKPYVFYTIGDLSVRKNIFKIISAFIKQFRNTDNVELIVKINCREDKAKADIEKKIRDKISKIYSELKIQVSRAKSPKIMIGDVDSKALRAIHLNSSCYIDASMGSNFGYSVLQASLFDRDIIVNKNISSAEIVETPYLLNSYLVNTRDSISEKFIDNRTEDYWMDVEYSDLCDKIFSAYTNRYQRGDQNTDIEMLKNRTKLIDSYSFKNSDKILC